MEGNQIPKTADTQQAKLMAPVQEVLVSSEDGQSVRINLDAATNFLQQIGISDEHISDLCIKLTTGLIDPNRPHQRGVYNPKERLIVVSTYQDDMLRGRTLSLVNEILTCNQDEIKRQDMLKKLEQSFVTRKLKGYIEQNRDKPQRVEAFVSRLCSIKNRKNLEIILLHEMSHFIDYTDSVKIESLIEDKRFLELCLNFYLNFLFPVTAVNILTWEKQAEKPAEILLTALAFSLLWYTIGHHAVKSLIYDLSYEERSARRFAQTHSNNGNGYALVKVF